MIVVAVMVVIATVDGVIRLIRAVVTGGVSLAIFIILFPVSVFDLGFVPLLAIFHALIPAVLISGIVSAPTVTVHVAIAVMVAVHDLIAVAILVAVTVTVLSVNVRRGAQQYERSQSRSKNLHQSSFIGPAEICL